MYAEIVSDAAPPPLAFHVEEFNSATIVLDSSIGLGFGIQASMDAQRAGPLAVF